MEQSEQSQANNAECSKSKIAFFWDALGTWGFLIAAFVTDGIIRALFPGGLSVALQAVVTLSVLTFGTYALRCLTDEIVCLIKSISRGTVLTARIPELVARKESHIANTSKSQGKKGNKGGRRKGK